MLAWIRDLYTLSQDLSLGDLAAEGNQRTLQHILSGFGADAGFLALAGETGLSVAAVRALPDIAPGMPLGSVAGSDGTQAPIGDLGAAGAAPAWLAPDGERSIYLPLLTSNKCIGALYIQRHPDRPRFDITDWERGSIMVGLLAVVLDNRRLHDEQQRRIEELSRMNAEIRAMNERLDQTQNQLVQAEKLASIGQLAAGVAHEINNPIGYVHSNLGSLEAYVEDVFRVLDACATVGPAHACCARVRALRQELDIDFLREDTRALLSETREGIARVKKIVQDLKDFSHVGGEEEWISADLHKCLDSTLNIINNEIKYKAKVIKQYGDLPEVPCNPSQLNQVFMNLLVNAAHAIEDFGTVTITTDCDDKIVYISIADTGCGIKPEVRSRIFDPFFTTKPIGKGTGLGLWLSYGIVQKHCGAIEVESEPGKGSTFRILLPRTWQEGASVRAPLAGDAPTCREIAHA
jgi:signal transduction histidine kinase